MPPSRGLLPVEFCRGTKPSQAANSRPERNNPHGRRFKPRIPDRWLAEGCWTEMESGGTHLNYPQYSQYATRCRAGNLRTSRARTRKDPGLHSFQSHLPGNWRNPPAPATRQPVRSNLRKRLLAMGRPVCTANFAFVEPEREYGPAPFGWQRRSFQQRWRDRAVCPAP